MISSAKYAATNMVTTKPSPTPNTIGFSCLSTAAGICLPAFNMSREMASATLAPPLFRYGPRSAVSTESRLNTLLIAELTRCWLPMPCEDAVGSARFRTLSSAWFCQKHTQNATSSAARQMKIRERSSSR